MNYKRFAIASAVTLALFGVLLATRSAHWLDSFGLAVFIMLALSLKWVTNAPTRRTMRRHRSAWAEAYWESIHG